MEVCVPSHFTTFKLFVTYVLFYRPCYDRHALGHEDHPECSCKATFPFLPSTRRLLDALDFVLVNLSSFDVCDMRDMTDESCDEGNVCFIYLSSCQPLPKQISQVNMNDVLPMVRAICGIKVCVHVDNFFIAILRLDALPAVHCFSLRPL